MIVPQVLVHIFPMELVSCWLVSWLSAHIKLNSPHLTLTVPLVAPCVRRRFDVFRTQWGFGTCSDKPHRECVGVSQCAGFWGHAGTTSAVCSRAMPILPNPLLFQLSLSYSGNLWYSYTKPFPNAWKPRCVVMFWNRSSFFAFLFTHSKAFVFHIRGPFPTKIHGRHRDQNDGCGS